MFKAINYMAGDEISVTCPHYAQTPDVVSTKPVSPSAGWCNYPKSAEGLSRMHSLRQEGSAALTGCFGDQKGIF